MPYQPSPAANKTRRPDPIAPSERLAYRVDEFCSIVRLGRTTAYRLISEGKIQTVKIGGRRLITKASADALINGGEAA